MAFQRSLLHLSNSIKLLWLTIGIWLEKKSFKWKKIVKSFKWTLKLDFKDKAKLSILLVLLFSVNSNGNSYSGGRNSMLRTRVIGTRYGKLQGIILPMDQHKYLKPVEAYLGVPYATPPTGSNRYVCNKII